MPWMIVEEDGRYCVHKKNADGSAGDTVACHETQDMAKRQLAALYANEPGTGHRSQRMQQGEYDKLVALLDAGLTEYRSVPFVDFESKDDGWTFEGLAAVYDQESDVGPFTEEFRHGSFRKPLANGDNTRLIYEHAPPHLPVLGTIRGGTLTLKDDVRGLVTRGRIAQHYLGEAVRELIQRGDVKGMSPGMIVGRGNSQITARSDGRLHRTIMALKHLPEVSLTSDPVYAGTTAEMRSMWALAESLGDWQHALMGTYPQLESRAIVEPGTNEDKADPAPETQEREERCEKCDAVIDGEHECAPVPEQRSGVDTAEAEVAARRRRLHMMGLSLPRS